MIMSLVQFIFELCNSMLLHPDVLIRLRSVSSASIYSITNTLIKYSYTLASVSVANEKTHIMVRLSFDNPVPIVSRETWHMRSCCAQTTATTSKLSTEQKRKALPLLLPSKREWKDTRFLHVIPFRFRPLFIFFVLSTASAPSLSFFLDWYLVSIHLVT